MFSGFMISAVAPLFSGPLQLGWEKVALGARVEGGAEAYHVTKCPWAEHQVPGVKEQTWHQPVRTGELGKVANAGLHCNCSS